MFAGLQFSPVLHTDCTNAKENGKNVSVFVCATPDGKAMYFARRKKGMKECLAHVLRYLKDGIENEADRTWNKEMRSLIQEMIHYRNGLSGEAVPILRKSMGLKNATGQSCKKQGKNTTTFRQVRIIKRDITCI